MLEVIQQALMVLSVPLIILVYKKRNYADYILYYEAFRTLCEAMFVMDGWNTETYMQISLMFFLSYLVLCTGPIGQVFCLTVVFALLSLVIHPFIFNNQLTVAKTFVSIAFILALHLTNSLAATLFLYIAELHGKLHQLILENIRLLNGMHEGLLILSKADQSILFINRPVQKLFKNSIELK